MDEVMNARFPRPNEGGRVVTTRTVRGGPPGFPNPVDDGMVARLASNCMPVDR